MARIVSDNATPQQCQARYARATCTKRSWDEDEEARLALAVSGHGPSWTDISRAMANRTPEHCRDRWAEMSHKSKPPPNAENNKLKWTTEDDEQLVQSVNTHGKKWMLISKELGLGYTDKQVRAKVSWSLTKND